MNQLRPRAEVPRRRADRYQRLGVLTTLVEVLALRHPPTARHAAAVARYARVLAHDLGRGQQEQRLVHTAGLLHDIAKLALPERALRGGDLRPEDWALIRALPQEGATLVGRLEGYGPVAELILYHHEQVDGAGYPTGLIGREIPLLARVLAVCNVYDTLTATDSYRQPSRTPDEAVAELDRVAGRQLDAELVGRFIELVLRDAVGESRDDHDFQRVLEYERRALGLG